jgi:N-acyl-D-amino-acid deacylase
MRRLERMPSSLLLLTLVGFAGGAPVPVDAQQFDVLIRNGRVLDGTGNPEIIADVGIRGDRIVAVGRLTGARGAREIDATGLWVVPGFVDLHSHADRALAGDEVELRQARNVVMQGITTIVGGPDGRNMAWPIRDEMELIRSLGIGVNFVPMVGHGTVRSAVMGDDYERTATEEEIRRMQALVREGMEQGAWGLGAGPEYRPGRFSNTEELIALARVVADYDGFYYSHQRTQSPLPQWQYPSMVKAMPEIGYLGTQETIEIGRETGIRVVGTHIKTKGTDTWGWSAADVIAIDRARAEGVQVFLDQYPYETFGGGAHTMLLPWLIAPPGTDYTGGRDDPKWRNRELFQDFRANLERNLADPVTGPLFLEDMEYYVRKRGGADGIFIVDAPFDPSLVGRSVAEVAAEWRLSPVETIFEFARRHGTPEDPDAVRYRSNAGHPWDVEHYMKQDYTATSTDGVISLEAAPGQHPRSWGAFVRKISHYVKETGTVSLPFAVRSNSGLPAMIAGLRDRGLVREGFHADVVVFDYERLDDRASVLEPAQYPEGIEYVLVNGQLVVDRGRPTGALPGRVLDRNQAVAATNDGPNR